MDFKRRRISAFLLDMLFVLLLTVSVCQLNYLNPYKYEVQEVTNTYNEAYENVMKEIMDGKSLEVRKLQETLVPLAYQMEKCNLFLYIWYLLFVFLYFVVFAYFNDGMTLGKKLFKLKVVNKEGEHVGFKNLCLRILFVGSSFYLGINLIVLLKIIVLLINQSTVYFYTFILLNLATYAFEIALFITLLLKKGDCALDDKIGGTRVLSWKE